MWTACWIGAFYDFVWAAFFVPDFYRICAISVPSAIIGVSPLIVVFPFHALSFPGLPLGYVASVFGCSRG
jgi:hypothetical protein